jgi:hypothetical protein
MGSDQPLIVRIIGWLALGATLLPFSAMAQSVPLDGLRYRNESHHFSVDIPPGMLTCVQRDFYDHGVSILLSGGTNCEGEENKVPRLSFYGAYTATGDVQTLGDLRTHICTSADKTKPATRLPPVMMGGRRAIGCRQDRNNGLVDVIYATLRRTKDPDALDWSEIGIWLETTPQNLDVDMKTTRRLLRGLHIDRDEPARH